MMRGVANGAAFVAFYAGPISCALGMNDLAAAWLAAGFGFAFLAHANRPVEPRP